MGALMAKLENFLRFACEVSPKRAPTMKLLCSHEAKLDSN